MISGPWLFGCVGYIGDEILPSSIGIIINRFFFVAQVVVSNISYVHPYLENQDGLKPPTCF